MKIDRHSPFAALTLRWGWGDYVRMEPNVHGKWFLAIGFTNYLHIGKLTIRFYHYPWLLKLFQHLRRMDDFYRHD